MWCETESIKKSKDSSLVCSPKSPKTLPVQLGSQQAPFEVLLCVLENLGDGLLADRKIVVFQYDTLHNGGTVVLEDDAVGEDVQRGD